MTDSPRILVFSERNLETPKWQAPQYEFEDVIATVDSARIVAPAPAGRGPLNKLRHRALRQAGRIDRVTYPEARPVRVQGDYDLFFCVMHFPADLAHLHRLRGWREHSKVAICYLVELFGHQVEEASPYLRLLQEFDHVFMLHPVHADKVQALSGRRCDFMGAGVDALRFSPYPSPPRRVIDFYALGRRSPYTHEAALGLARSGERFYVYDTIYNAPLPDPAAHREAVASMVKRSRYFFAYNAGEDQERADGEDVVSPRYVEGMSGGAIVLGSAPDLAQFRELFPWPDATIRIPYEARDLPDIIAQLERQPERLATARRNNMLGALRRHDWVYRWEQVLDAAGLLPTQAMGERKARLEELAQMVEAEDLERL